MLLFIMVTSCSKGDDNTVDPDTTPTAKLPTLRLTTSPKDAFVNEDIAFKVVDEKGNVVIDAKLFVNEQALNATTFSSKTAASFKVYAQKAGFKTSYTVEIRFMDKEDVDAIVTGKMEVYSIYSRDYFQIQKRHEFYLSEKLEAEDKNMGKYNPVLYLVDEMRYYSLYNSSTLLLEDKHSTIKYYFKVSSYTNRETVGTLYLDGMIPSNGIKLTLQKK